MKTKQITINDDRLKSTIESSSIIGKIPGDGLRRLALTDEDKKMRDTFKGWMEESGLETRIDDFGNMYGRRKGELDLSPILIGSHLDTQPNGGRFDGILGVLTALEVIRTLNDHNIQTKRPIEIVNFTNEEGARFEPPLLGSGGVTGVFQKDYVYNRVDRDGKRFEDELERIGYKGSQSNRIEDIYAFIELHIEQGPILENEGVSIGAVEGIKGMTWFELKVKGEGGHAGPTPMQLRKDALMAATQMIGRIKEKAEEYGPDMCVTVGRISARPGVVNCIPEEVIFSLDVRHIEDKIRNKLIQEIQSELQDMAQLERVKFQIEKLWEVDTTHFNQEIVKQIVHSAKGLNYSVKRMFSGAGHDAKYMSDVCPTGMIFIPSVNGISHVESEFTEFEDIKKGADVLLHTVIALAKEYR